MSSNKVGWAVSRICCWVDLGLLFFCWNLADPLWMLVFVLAIAAASLSRD